MKVYQLRIVNEAGEEAMNRIYKDRSDAEITMYGMAIVDYCEHLNVGSRLSEEEKCLSCFLDSVKKKVSTSGDWPHDAFAEALIDEVSVETGINYSITELEVW